MYSVRITGPGGVRGFARVPPASSDGGVRLRDLKSIEGRIGRKKIALSDVASEAMTRPSS